MNIKRSIICTLESRKKNGVPVVENVPIRMYVTSSGQRVELTTGYRIDVSKWNADKQRVKNGCTNRRKVLYVDTEQSPYHCLKVMKRILQLAGLPNDRDNENLEFLALRKYTPG